MTKMVQANAKDRYVAQIIAASAEGSVWYTPELDLKDYDIESNIQRCDNHTIGISTELEITVSWYQRINNMESKILENKDEDFELVSMGVKIGQLEHEIGIVKIEGIVGCKMAASAPKLPDSAKFTSHHIQGNVVLGYHNTWGVDQATIDEDWILDNPIPWHG